MARKKLSEREIQRALADLNGWKIEDVNLKRRFEFKNFAEALNFVNQVGAIAESADHHPDISFGWGYAEFSITTHDTGGLTQNDFDLAREIEAIWTELETLKFEINEQNRSVVTVHQIVKDSDGNVLADAEVRPIFTIEDDLTSLYEIGEADTINEMIQKNKAASEQWDFQLLFLAIVFYQRGVNYLKSETSVIRK